MKRSGMIKARGKQKADNILNEPRVACERQEFRQSIWKDHLVFALDRPGSGAQLKLSFEWHMKRYRDELLCEKLSRRDRKRCSRIGQDVSELETKPVISLPVLIKNSSLHQIEFYVRDREMQKSICN